MTSFIARSAAFVLLMPLWVQFADAKTFQVTDVADLRAALQEAASNGEDDIIELADGQYSTTSDGKGTFKYLSVEQNTLKLVGSHRDLVVLSGEGVDQVIRHNVEAGSGSLTLEKITIADGTNAGNAGLYGGGVYTKGHIIVKNSAFLRNSAVKAQVSTTSFANTAGGGFHAFSAQVTDSIFEDNFANHEGGAFHLSDGEARVKNTTFLRNLANKDSGNGGGISAKELYVESSFFEGNTAIYGAAIYDRYSGRPSKISRSIFVNNSARGSGGAVMLTNAEISNSIFRGNRGGSGTCVFGGVSTLITNSLFIENRTNEDFNYVGDPSFPCLYLTELAGEKRVVNSIFVDNGVDISGSVTTLLQLKNSYVNPDIVNLDIAGGFLESANIYDGIVLGFLNRVEGNFRLTSESGFIDAGAEPSDIDLGQLDLDGQVRVFGGSIDIGPYEFVPDASVPTILSLNVSGELRVGSVITFSFEIDPADVESGVTTYFDFGDGEEQIAEGGQYVFDTPGSYTVKLIVVNEEGARSSRSLSFDIRDLTLEEKLDAAEQAGRDSVINNPALYGLLTSSDLEAQLGELQGELTAELESAVQTAYEAVKNDPTAFGIDVGFDIDGDGESKALTDGLLLIRYLFGFTGDSLVQGALGDGAERNTAEEIETYLGERMPKE
jgi:hypothetical protein